MKVILLVLGVTWKMLKTFMFVSWRIPKMPYFSDGYLKTTTTHPWTDQNGYWLKCMTSFISKGCCLVLPGSSSHMWLKLNFWLGGFRSELRGWAKLTPSCLWLCPNWSKCIINQADFMKLANVWLSLLFGRRKKNLNGWIIIFHLKSKEK